jgi:HTH-type transcriptional regulator/antitoxin MqsA
MLSKGTIMAHNHQTCKICGSTDVVLKTEDVTVQYGQYQRIVENYQSFHCSECGEDIVEPNSLKRYDQEFIALKRKAEGLLSPSEIREIRAIIDLTQDEAGQILGGGPKAFAKYENGKIPQSKAMDNLLRFVKANPSMVKLLMAGDLDSEKSLVTPIFEEVHRLNVPIKNTVSFGKPHYQSFSKGEFVCKLNSVAL